MSDGYSTKDLFYTNDDVFSLALGKLVVNEKTATTQWKFRIDREELIKSLQESDDQMVGISFLVFGDADSLEKVREGGFFPPLFEFTGEKGEKPLSLKLTNSLGGLPHSQAEIDDAVAWAEEECVRLGWHK